MSSSRHSPAARLYDDDGDLLLEADSRADRIILLPSGDPRRPEGEGPQIRIQWGQHLLSDLIAQRYRTLICGVNGTDNSRGIIAQLAATLPASQWDAATITHHAALFARSPSGDDVPVLKYDLDSVEVLALLRPASRDHFTVDDLSKGFRKAAQMIDRRRERLPVAMVSFLGAKSNRLVGPEGLEPSLEAVLRAAFDAGIRGDLYPPLSMWEVAPTGVFATYPFSSAIDRMREGGD
jgi:hypothetical protein